MVVCSYARPIAHSISRASSPMAWVAMAGRELLPRSRRRGSHSKATLMVLPMPFPRYPEVKVTFAKKAPLAKVVKRRPAPVVDDWEAAEVEEEEKERIAYASASEGEALGVERSRDPLPLEGSSSDESVAAETAVAKVDETIDEGAETRDWAEGVTLAEQTG